jgi:hypothetical protein
MGSDLSKVQFQVDLSMRSIQALKKEHVLLVQMIHSGGPAGPSGSQGTTEVMGPSLAALAFTMASLAPPHPVPPPSHQGGSAIPRTTHPTAGGSHHSGGDSNMRR